MEPESEPEKNVEKENEFTKKFKGNWPSQGKVNFKKIFMRYHQNQNYALRGVSL
jgi:ABC-type bacteriocin/lantibiotic exporter with double-glycine peptidase domain